MPKRLKDLLINRVDLVDKGDNPGASIALFKRDQDSDGGDVQDSNIFLSATDSGVERLLEVFKKLFHKEGVKHSMPFDVKKFAQEHADEQLQKQVEELSDEQLAEVGKVMESLEEDQRTALILGYEATKQAMQSKIDSLLKQDEDDDDDEDEDEDDNTVNNAAKGIPQDVLKQLPEDVRKVIEDNQKKTDEAIGLAKKLQQEKLEGEYVAKAKKFPSVVAKAEELGPVLKRIADNSANDYKVIEAVLKAAEERISRNDQIFKELGAAGEEGGGDAWDKIEKEAEEIRKADPNLTKEMAIEKAMSSNSKLYSEYQKELHGEVQ